MMDEEKERFSRIPHVLVDSGLLAKLKRSEIMVYLVISRYAHHKTGNAFPGFKRICREAGVNKNFVGPAIEKLVNYGLITKRRAPGAFKFRNVFKVIRNPEIKGVITPSYQDKRSGIFRRKDGKWAVRPSHQDLDICPSEKELHISPIHQDKKDIEIYENKDSNRKPTISQKTLEELEKAMGEAKLKQYLKEQGYNPDILKEKKSSSLENYGKS